MKTPHNYGIKNMRKSSSKILILSILSVLLNYCSLFNSSNGKKSNFSRGYCEGVRLVNPKPEIKLLFLSTVESNELIKPPILEKGNDYLESRFRYPKLPLQAGVQGIVIIEFLVDSLGQTKNIKVVNSIGEEFDEATTNVIREIKFHPATLLQKRINTKMKAKILYRFSR